MEARLRQALTRADEVGQALADPATARDPSKLRSLGREHTRLAPVVKLADRLSRLQRELEEARELAAESDPELVALAKADLARLPAEISGLTDQLHELLLPRDPHDHRDAIMEIRAGTGGDEAALFAADLGQRGTARRNQGGHRRGAGRGCLRDAPAGIRRSPGAAGSGHGNPGTNP